MALSKAELEEFIFDMVAKAQGKKQLKAEITTKINSFLQSGQIKSIYFTDFVVQ